MTTTTAVPAVIDYLVDTFTAAPTLGAAADPVTIIDGPETFQYSGRALWVGVDDLDSAAPLAAESNQEWVGVGARARDEQLSVFCILQGWGGDQKFRSARDDAAATLAAIEAVLRGDVYLGGLTLFQAPGMTGAIWMQAFTDKGAAVRIPFRIEAKARLGGP